MARRALVFALALAGCSASTGRTTWEQDRADGVAHLRPAVSPLMRAKRPTRRALTLDDSRTVAVDYEALAHALELDLLRFSARRQALAKELDEASVWPRPMVEAFETILVRVEKGLAAPRGALPRRVLIQTRVTLEVELDKTKMRFGAPPDTLSRRVRDDFVKVAMHMQASRKVARRRSTKPKYDVRLAWPLTPLIVTSPFGYRRDPILGQEEVRFHAGVDLGANRGDVVSAAGPGRVSSVGWLGGHGRTVVVQHAGGFVTMYAHLKRALVGVGAEVHRGTPIGLVGNTGRSTGPHLHFEVRRGSVPIDPMDAVGASLGALATSD
ncbi:MAG: M23 family metallopeptidase [Deltaproteobacteria bacterium]